MIGVFDSGCGGLTVLRELRSALPRQHFIYYGDHRNAPYGGRDADAIYALTLAAVSRLFALGCSLVVVACNTAAATGLRRLQQTWLPAHFPEKRVIGVIVPLIEALTGQPWTETASCNVPPPGVADKAGLTPGMAPDLRENGTGPKCGHHAAPRPAYETVAVFATQYTVDSLIFVEETRRRAPGMHLIQQACPSLVPLIEAGAPTSVLRKAVQGYAGRLLERFSGKPPQAALLGCTHYPLIQHLFAEALPAGTEIFSQPRISAASLADYLARHPGLVTQSGAGVAFYTSGDPESVTRLARRMAGDARLRFEHLPAAGPTLAGTAGRRGKAATAPQ